MTKVYLKKKQRCWSCKECGPSWTSHSTPRRLKLKNESNANRTTSFSHSNQNNGFAALAPARLLTGIEETASRPTYLPRASAWLWFWNATQLFLNSLHCAVATKCRTSVDMHCPSDWSSFQKPFSIFGVCSFPSKHTPLRLPTCCWQFFWLANYVTAPCKFCSKKLARRLHRSFQHVSKAGRHKWWNSHVFNSVAWYRVKFGHRLCCISLICQQSPIVSDKRRVCPPSDAPTSTWQGGASIHCWSSIRHCLVIYTSLWRKRWLVKDLALHWDTIWLSNHFLLY